MQNILNYVRFRSDIPFSKMPFNEADALAFMAIAYLDYSGLIEGCEPLASVAEKYKSRAAYGKADYLPYDKEEVLYAMAGSRRYRRVKITDYLHEINGKECRTTYAVTFYLNAFTSIVAYPGTDETLLSWKENFSFLYKIPAPGQLRCLEYLNQHLTKRFCKTLVIGHSKGGNLAVFSAMNAEEKKQKKIRGVCLFDPTGQSFDFYDQPGYLRIRDRIRTFVPVDCVIGNLFYSDYPNRRIVNSPEIKFGQHEVMNWSVAPSGFDYGKATSEFSRRTSKIFNDLFHDVPMDKRETVIEELFGIFFSNGITRIDEINHMNFMNSLKLVAKYPSMSPETKNLLKTLLHEMKA